MWASDISDAVQANVVLADLVDRSYEPDMKFGDTLRIDDDANLAVRIKATDTSAMVVTQKNSMVKKALRALFHTSAISLRGSLMV